MQNLNSVTLIGRVGADPESKEVNGATVTQFRMATNRAWLDASGQKKEVATWHRIVAWSKTAEACQQYVHKGMMVFVTGSIETREYDKDGERRSITEIRAQQVGFLSSREAGGQSQASSSAAPRRSDDRAYGGQPAVRSGYGDARSPASRPPARPAQGSGWGPPSSHVADEEVPF